MVAKMKKLTFLIYHKDYEQFLRDLRELGVVHVVENKLNQAQSERLDKLYMQWKQLTEAKKMLEKYRDKKNPLPPNPVDVKKGYRLPQEIEKIQADAATLMQQLQISKRTRRIDSVGEFRSRKHFPPRKSRLFYPFLCSI